MTLDAKTSAPFGRIRNDAQSPEDPLERLLTLEETTAGRETHLRVPEHGRVGSSRPEHGDVPVSRPASSHLRLVHGARRAAPSGHDVADANPAGAWLQLLDLTMAKLEAAVAAFEKERNEFEKWASDERAAIARERSRRGRWFR